MNDYRYILDKSSKKFICPDCGKKRFVRYIDTQTGDYLPEQYGRCDKGDGHYFLDPYTDGYAKMIWKQEQGNRSELPNNWKPQRKKVIPQPTPEPVFFDFETFKQTLQPERYEKNTFIRNLLYREQFPFEVDEVTKVIQLYRLGTVVNGYRAGAITFPFIDFNGNIRAIQVKQFDKQNHTTGTDFLHSIIAKEYTRNNKPLPEWLDAYTKQEKFISCLFGEHLLNKYPKNPVALVEAPKTAIYGTLYFGFPETPENFIWLAVYNKSSFSFDKLKVLQGRFVCVFPDLSKDGNTFWEWQAKVKEYEKRLMGTRFIFSDLLERLAPEQDRKEGLDLADYLTNMNWRLFRKQGIQEQPTQPEPEPKPETKQFGKVVDLKDVLALAELLVPKVEQPKEPPANWDGDVSELENFFSNIEIPNQPFQLNNYTTVKDCSLFIKSHLATVKRHNGNETYYPFLEKLKELKQYFEQQKEIKQLISTFSINPN